MLRVSNSTPPSFVNEKCFKRTVVSIGIALILIGIIGAAVPGINVVSEKWYVFIGLGGIACLSAWIVHSFQKKASSKTTPLVTNPLVTQPKASEVVAQPLKREPYTTFSVQQSTLRAAIACVEEDFEKGMGLAACIPELAGWVPLYKKHNTKITPHALDHLKNVLNIYERRAKPPKT